MVKKMRKIIIILLTIFCFTKINVYAEINPNLCSGSSSAILYELNTDKMILFSIPVH